MGSPRRVDDPVQQQQRWPLEILRRIEHYIGSVAVLPKSGILGLDFGWAAEQLGPCGNIERVQSLMILIRTVFGGSHQINGPVGTAVAINDWCCRDADLRTHRETTAIIAAGISRPQQR